MEVKLTAKQIELKEVDKICGIVQALWKEGSLTDIECRLIISSYNLVEMKASFFSVMMSKTEEEAVILAQKFKKLTAATHTEENSTSLHNPTDNSDVESNDSVLLSTNPFLDIVIIKHLFGVVPVKDMKQYRLVCRQWNSTAEICLRKRSTIHFRPNALLPCAFMKASQYSYPDVPFQSFKFSNDEKSQWPISDIKHFFIKWRKNIKEVEFHSVALFCKSSEDILGRLTHKEVLSPNYEITELFFMPSKITCLKISYSLLANPKTILAISLEKFVSIKTLSLSYCTIVSTNNQNTRIAPINVKFVGVDCKQNGDMLPSFEYSDVVDFSQATNIHLNGKKLENRGNWKPKFDMSKQIFNVNQLHLESVDLDNWAQAKGEVQFLNLINSPFVEKNELKIKQIRFRSCDIDLSALPQTLEMLDVGDEGTFARNSCEVPLYLPNLKYLQMVVKDSEFYLAHFSHCLNLVDLALFSTFSRSWVDACCFPKNVNRVRICFPRPLIKGHSVILDTLILDSTHENLCSFVRDCTEITSRILAEVVVMVCDIDTIISPSEIVQFVLSNKKAEKILIGSNSGLFKRTPFEGSELSKCVDKKSDFYQFENGFGKSIAKEEFQRYAEIVEYFPDYISKRLIVF